MKKLIVLAVAIALFACTGNTENQEEENVMTVSEFLLDADQYENATIQLIGQVDHICMGSKAKIHFVCPEHPEEYVKIFAGEELKEFSDTLMDQIIKITGVVEVSTKIDQEYLDKWEQELADKAAETAEETVEATEEHHHGDGEAHEHHDGEEKAEAHHHHGNQQALIAKYRKQIELSGKDYINLYKVVVTAIEPAPQPEKEQ